LATIAAAKDPPVHFSTDKKPTALHWEPPNVDAPVPSISGAPACSLPDVLKHAGERAQELVGHLQEFVAREQIRYVQTARLDMGGSTSSVGKSQMPYAEKDVLELSEMRVTANFNYQVDYGEQSDVLHVHETRTPVSTADDPRIAAIVSKGLPVLALIFSPALQNDYEISCEGSALWNDHAAWVVHFRQTSGNRPRTFRLETARGSYPLSIKGRAWIAKDSGQVMHLETNLVDGVLAIDLQSNAISVDYGPVKFKSQNIEIWLPQFAVAYTDFDKRRMISEHSFANFQLFTVQTKELVHTKNPPADASGVNQPPEGRTAGEAGTAEKFGAKADETKTAANTRSVTSTPVTTRWSPLDVDASISPVEPGSACDLEGVLRGAGAQIQEMVANLEHFTATESLLQETINKSGRVSGSEKRKYDYLVSIGEIRPGILSVQEDLNDGADSAGYPGGFVTKGLPALMLIFHPYYSDTFSMKCEGLAELDGKRTWQIYFRQRADKPNRIRAYSVGVNGPSNTVALKGRAWFVADNYQIMRLQADLIDSIPEIRLTVDHTDIEYGPVHSNSLGTDIWLPHTAELYTDFRGRRIHQRMNYTDYLLFAVDERQKIADPKVSD
jgi:hypothetical protein